MFSSADDADTTAIHTAADDDEVQALTEELGELRERADDLESKARDLEAEARDLEREARDEGDLEAHEARERAAALRDEAEDLRDEARDLRREAVEVRQQRDERREAVDAAAKDAVEAEYIELLRQAADATEQAVQAHRRLRAFEQEFRKLLTFPPRAPRSMPILRRDPDKHGRSAAGFVRDARRRADELSSN